MSATVPMELTFGQGGNLKAARRLRDLDLKEGQAKQAVRPAFANTSQLITGASKASINRYSPRQGPIMPKPSGYPSNIQQKSVVPAPFLEGLANQGNEDGGGAVIPEQIASDIQQQTAPMTNGHANGKFFGKHGKHIAIGGGIALALIIVAYFMFFSKKRRKGRRRRK